MLANERYHKLSKANPVSEINYYTQKYFIIGHITRIKEINETNL